MSDHVNKKIEIVGSLEASTEEVLQRAISKAAETIKNLE